MATPTGPNSYKCVTNFDLDLGALSAISESFHPFLITFSPSSSESAYHKIVEKRTVWDGTGHRKIGRHPNAMDLTLTEEGDSAEAVRSKGSSSIRKPKLRDSV